MSKDIFNHLSQDQIVRAICLNDEAIIQQIYIDGFSKVRKFVLVNQGTEDEAKDIFQEAFLVVWQNVKNESFNPVNQTAVQGYLYKIAKNKWLDWLRSSRFKRSQKEDSSFLLDQHTEQEEENLEEKYLQLEVAFDKLGPDCQSILRNFYFLKKDMKEISDKFGWTPKTVKNNKYRCMEKLRKLVLHN